MPLRAGILPTRAYVATFRWCVRTDDAKAQCLADPLLVAVSAPLAVSYRSPRPQLRSVARAHGVVLSRAFTSRADIIDRLTVHVCTRQCDDLAYVFDISLLNISGSAGGGLAAATSVTATTFPPKAASPSDLARIVKGFCSATDEASMKEGACVVCARLTPCRSLSRLRLLDVDLTPLDRPGEKVTRRERISKTEPIVEHCGPVLYTASVESIEGVNYAAFCSACLNGLRAHRLPRHALANGRWIGSVPAVLQNLTYVEQLMIARFRHSFCVAQVTLGQRYLSANVIVFGQPVARAYQTLPPPRAEMQDILAIVVVGSARPSDEDFSRTPFLVRHRSFARSLEWLQVNSDTYEDIGFSAANLSEYPENRPVVGVIYREQAGTQGSENTASYDATSERGTSSGECAFIVHSVNAEDLASMTYDAKVALAIRHFDSGGRVLAYGHESRPESIYHNPKLYPGMFPWLYPYGKGGFENVRIETELDHIAHVRANLLYHDRRFQTDRCFPFIVFNQRQIRASAQGGFLLTQKGHFDDVSARILNLDRAALDSIIDRASSGEHVVPRTPGEKSCFDLIGIVDRVAGHVDCSTTQKKYQRNEIRSLIYQLGVPVFFVTFAPVDFKHPLCLYLCGEAVDLSSYCPSIGSSDDRLRAIARNPVGAARFFHIVVSAFIRYVLGVGIDGPGLFGDTEAYYGTVEAQGRLTLHLHLLMWLRGGISPQQMRDQLLSDPQFEIAVVGWLESCQIGQYSTTTGDDLRSELEEEYVDRRRGTECVKTRLRAGVRDPATMRPCPPRDDMSEEDAGSWVVEMQHEADRVVHMSNRHDQNHGKGCWRGKPGYCRARFPRDIVDTSQIDRSSGAIRFKHLEPWLNTYNPTLSFLLRCNSDVTCLLSGTQVKSVMAYVTDYVTKTKLTTESFFTTVRTIFDRNVDVLLDAQTQPASVARTLVVKTVNAIGSAAETGGPMVCASLLGQPDHYTGHKFKVFYWHTYYRWIRTEVDVLQDIATDQDRVLLGKTADGIVQLNKVLDYTCRPVDFGAFCLFDYLRDTEVRKMPARDANATVHTTRTSDGLDDEADEDLPGDDQDEDASDVDEDEQQGRDDVVGRAAHRFTSGHPLHATHGVYKRLVRVMLNFVGGSLPRPDRGDREKYCLTMLVFFRPGGWRSASDLLNGYSTFSESFAVTAFAHEHVQIMKNMNLLYECLDARDDFSAQRRALGLTGGPQVGSIDMDALDGLPVELPGLDDIPYDHTEDSLAAFMDEGGMGKHSARVHNDMESAHDTLSMPSSVFSDVTYNVEAGTLTNSIERHRPAYWKQLIQGARQRVLDRTLRRGDAVEPSDGCIPDTHNESDGFVKVLTSFALDRLRKHGIDISRGLQDPQLFILHTTIERYTLNDEQTRAFTLVARHLHHHEQRPLRMYLGGMAGTGKSRVLKALMGFLEDRGETHRFVVLGPTGASAALVGGSTYHSMLGLAINDENSSMTSLEKIRGRLLLVDLIFIDEVSMISCLAMFFIHTQLTKAFGDATLSFGGKSVIFAGDFAQLPPPGRGVPSLYSDSVGLWSSSATAKSQRYAIGKAVWHTFTDVVLLRTNMRQRGITDEDLRFRVALENLRYARCTVADIGLFQTRVCRPSIGSQVHLRPEFRYVSIITARNAHRDRFNSDKSKDFAITHGLPLYRFHSVDRWGRNKESQSVRDAQRSFERVVDPVRTSNIITPRLQTVLWNLPPALSEHHAGVLELCLGMPVLLKFNEATELCATNGAEAVVHDWVCHTDRGHLVLDTLFVELVNPPRPVQLQGLPVNVIPLGRTKRSVKCVLPVSDMEVYVHREQVMVLPNFSMTDFAAQGRTRLINVVHLRHCKGHQSLYTCLSRSSSLTGTLIIGDFKASKMRSGARFALRREFRELEMLDDITRLRCENQLPVNVSGQTRAELLASYVAWRGPRYVPPNVPEALSWHNAPSWELQLSISGGPPAEDDEDNNRNIVPSSLKRKRANERWTVAKVRLARNPNARRDRAVYELDDARADLMDSRDDMHVADGHRLGLIWDRVDYSCGYDAILTILWNLYCDRGDLWLSSLAPGNDLMHVVRARFVRARDAPEELEVARDGLRDAMQCVDSEAFPRHGTRGIVLSELMRTLFTCGNPHGVASVVCNGCGATVSHLPETLTSYMWPLHGHWWNEVFPHRRSVSAQECVLRQLSNSHVLNCPSCALPAELHPALTTAPELIVLDCPVGCVVIPTENIVLPIGGSLHGYVWVGAVYFGFAHYTSRFRDSTGNIWYHDGATSGRYCIRDQGDINTAWIATARSRELSHIIYARMH